jgi:hypothetical protein
LCRGLTENIIRELEKILKENRPKDRKARSVENYSTEIEKDKNKRWEHYNTENGKLEPIRMQFIMKEREIMKATTEKEKEKLRRDYIELERLYDRERKKVEALLNRTKLADAVYSEIPALGETEKQNIVSQFFTIHPNYRIEILKIKELLVVRKRELDAKFEQYSQKFDQRLLDEIKIIGESLAKEEQKLQLFENEAKKRDQPKVVQPTIPKETTKVDTGKAEVIQDNPEIEEKTEIIEDNPEIEEKEKKPEIKEQEKEVIKVNRPIPSERTPTPSAPKIEVPKETSKVDAAKAVSKAETVKPHASALTTEKTRTEELDEIIDEPPKVHEKTQAQEVAEITLGPPKVHEKTQAQEVTEIAKGPARIKSDGVDELFFGPQTEREGERYYFPTEMFDNEILGIVKGIKFLYLEDINKVQIKFEHGEIKFVKLSAQINYMLGYEINKVLVNEEVAKYTCDLKGGLSSFGVYAKGLTENIIMGNELVSLLRIVAVSGKYGDIVEKIYDSPIFSRILPKEINEIEIELRTTEGRLVPFAWGQTLVTLVFKKAVYF